MRDKYDLLNDLIKLKKDLQDMNLPKMKKAKL